MQWHRDNHWLIGSERIQSVRCLFQHSPENRGSRTHLLILQQVNQLAQATVIASISHGFDEGRSQFSAQTASSFLGSISVSKGSLQPLSADGADCTLNRLNFAQAGLANRQAGNVGQGSTAKTAIGRKKGSENAFSNTAHGRNQS